MAWKELYAVGKMRDPLVKAAVELPRKTLLLAIAKQVGAPQRSDEQKVSCEKGDR